MKLKISRNWSLNSKQMYNTNNYINVRSKADKYQPTNNYINVRSKADK